jgi:hypothetical protein
MNNCYLTICPQCSTINQIYIDNDNIHAYQCCFCFNNSWIDIDDLEDYMNENNIDYDIANTHLQNGDISIKYAGYI